VRRFARPEDQEIVALVAASLAFGTVRGILASIDRVLQVLPAPHADLTRRDPAALRRDLRAFRHRYVGGEEMADLLLGARAALRRHGSLRASFAAGLDPRAETVLPALCAWVDALRPAGSPARAYLLSDPRRGGACKRHCMMLRWLARRDAVDLGIWPEVSPAQLLVPLDTHLFRVARALRLTRRRTPNQAAVLEITARFRALRPEDPVRYDFALTRMGIRREEDVAEFARRCLARPGKRDGQGVVTKR
jgi:uncharacterized protein (TIGR02757 family)